MMQQNIVFDEYRNQNAKRVYPFVDDATMTSDETFKLPPDFLIDAFLYPIDLSGVLYLSKIDTANGAIEFADTDTNDVQGTATYTKASTSAVVYDNSGYEREIGVLVFGAGLSMLPAAGVLNFQPEATALVPATFVPMNQAAVRGFVFANSGLYTGDVVLAGGLGVSVYTHDNIVKVDAIGAPVASSDECELGPPIRCIRFKFDPDTPFALAQYDSEGTLVITTRNLDLADLCPPGPAPVTAPSPCEKPAAPHKEPTSHYPAGDLLICATAGRIEIVPASTGSYDNPIVIRPIQLPVGNSPVISIPKTNGQNILATSDAVAARLIEGLRPRGGLEIGFAAGVPRFNS